MPRKESTPFTKLPPHALDRFWDYVIVGDPSQCWEWQGHQSMQGYGRFETYHPTVHWLAHRIAYYIGHGKDPGIFLAMHKCDNPPCVNWNHLTLGTTADNTADAMRKGRWKPLGALYGAQNGRTKLTEEQVREIRRLHRTISLMEIATRFNVTRRCIRGVVYRENWRYLA